MASTSSGAASEPSRRARVISLLAISLAFLLAGCSESASHLEERSVVWPDGKPSGPLEDSEWGQVYRHAEIEMSLATGNGDFSDPDLIAAVGYDLAHEVAWASRALDPQLESARPDRVLRYTSYASIGTIIKIEEHPDTNSATVVVCGGWGLGLNGARSGLYTWTFARTPSGAIEAFDEFTSDWETCSSVVPRLGLWAEPFDVADFDHTKVKMPLPREYYVKLGVIDE